MARSSLFHFRNSPLYACFLDAVTGKRNVAPVRLPDGDFTRVESILFTSGGVCLALIRDSLDRPTAPEEVVRLWNLTTGWEVGTPKRLKGRLTAAAFSSDGKRVALGVAGMGSLFEKTNQEESTVSVWNLVSDQFETRILQHKGGVRALRCLPDTGLIAIVEQGNSIIRCLLPPTLDVNQVKLRVAVALGVRLKLDGRVEMIPSEEWIDLRQQLREAEQQKTR